MFVKAFLLYRKGIGSFDPVSDGQLIFNGEPDDARYYTWRKDGQPIPGSCTAAGIFLGDHRGYFTFVGTRHSGSPGYLESIYSNLEQGYEHSDFHRLFQAPVDVMELLEKLAAINHLYFGACDVESGRPENVSEGGFSWHIDSEHGITKVMCPDYVDPQTLRETFYSILKKDVPTMQYGDPRIAKTKAVQLRYR